MRTLVMSYRASKVSIAHIGLVLVVAAVASLRLEAQGRDGCHYEHQSDVGYRDLARSIRHDKRSHDSFLPEG